MGNQQTKFFQYDFTSDILCMGERMKAGLFRPTARTIRYSQIVGALKAHFGPLDFHAVGYLDDDEKFNQSEYLTYAPRDRVSGTSRLPLQIEVLTNVKGKVFVLANEAGENLPPEFEIGMGALLSKGLGKCILSGKSELPTEGYQVASPPTGFRLRVRIPEKHAEKFLIRNVLSPFYGYLFEPTSPTTGVYVRSLFEGSIVVGPKFLLEKEVKK